jgi:hypothetical protein
MIRNYLNGGVEMKTRLEKMIKREDGSRIKIIVEIFNVNYGSLQYKSSVLHCDKGKRTWRGTFNSDDYEYRGLSMDDRRKFEYESQLEFVSDQEILQAKIELWESLKPLTLKNI